jgi:hypothetical protein
MCAQLQAARRSATERNARSAAVTAVAGLVSRDWRRQKARRSSEIPFLFLLLHRGAAIMIDHPALAL